MDLLARITFGIALLIPAAIVGRADPLISTSLPGSPMPVSHVLVDFYTGAEGGASGLYQGDLYQYGGPQLIPGSTASPTYGTGSFLFEDDFLLTISAQGIAAGGTGQKAVPEPSPLALFGIGLLIGCGLIHRKLGGRKL